MEKFKFIKGIVAKLLAKSVKSGIHYFYGNKYYVEFSKDERYVTCVITKQYHGTPFYRELVMFGYDYDSKTLYAGVDDPEVYDKDARKTLIAAFKTAKSTSPLRINTSVGA